MNNKEKPKFTARQYLFIESLVDQLGYKDSAFRHQFLTHVLRRCYSIDSTSSVIDKLLKELKSRKMVIRKQQVSDYTIVSELSEYVFCPASHSIKGTYIVPRTIEEEMGTEMHERHHVEEFLSSLTKQKSTNKYYGKNIRYLPALFHEYFDELLSSKVLYRGHEENSIPFVSKNGGLRGIPDYIFQHRSGYCIVVEEKHTWQEEEVVKPWPSDVVQLLGYLYGISDFNIVHGYLFYFSWYMERDKKRVRIPTIYKIEKNNDNKNLISKVYVEVNEFKRRGEMSFSSKDINVNKCIKCSSRVFCRHKSGKEDILKYPY